MRPRKNEYGGAGALVFWLLVLILAVYLGTKFLPPYVSSNEFVDSMESQAKEAAAGNLADEKVRAELMRRSKELGLPIKESDIRIAHTGGEVIINVSYVVDIEVPIYGTYHWTFTPRAAKPVLN